jgi:hypothetical protein
LVANGLGSFNVESHGKSAGLAGQGDIAGLLDQYAVFGPIEQPSAHAGERLEVGLDAMVAEADVQRHGVNPGIPVTLKLGKK